MLFLINSCLWLSTYECCKITRLCSVYTLGIVHVCLGICLLAACTNKTKKSLLSQNKLPLDMSKKLYLPHPSSVQSSVLPASLALPLFGATRKKLPTQLNPLITPSRSATKDFLHARLPQCQYITGVPLLPTHYISQNPGKTKVSPVLLLGAALPSYVVHSSQGIDKNALLHQFMPKGGCHVNPCLTHRIIKY